MPLKVSLMKKTILNRTKQRKGVDVCQPQTKHSHSPNGLFTCVLETDPFSTEVSSMFLQGQL